MNGVVPLVCLTAVCLMCVPVSNAATVHHNAISICAIIITELTEGRVSATEARKISLAIAEAGNRHFGRVTCGDMWLYMAIAYIESGFKKNVVNHYNCRGMFQIHAPSWARKFGVRYSDLFHVETNADIGVQVFKYYLETYKYVIPALSAYNSDHPGAARGYAHAVLNARKRIQKRYTELYKAFRSVQNRA
ncbi:MAG: transglycosylase SLT domain-containing protein [Desulfomonilaceae bacterium]|nr:transglycosylase SLT domain-containing protein [Desulfomonilaceae bacterium]